MSFRFASLALLGAVLLPVHPRAAGAQARAVSAAGTPATSAASARAAAVSSFTYRFRIDDDEDGGRLGTVQVVNGQSRVDMDRRGGEERDWFLVAADGRTITVVDPQEREYRRMRAEEFEEIAGTALRSVRGIVNFELVGRATIDFQRLGAGETIAGMRTERIRVVETFTVRPRVFGMRTEPKRHRVTTTYWVTRDVAIPRNPLVELLAKSSTAIAQQDEEYAGKSRALRARLFEGSPVKVEVTSDEGDGKRESTVSQIVEVRRRKVDAAVFRVPAGYREGEGKGKGFGLNL